MFACESIERMEGSGFQCWVFEPPSLKKTSNEVAGDRIIAFRPRTLHIDISQYS